MIRKSLRLIPLFLIVAASAVVHAQSPNLLQNPDAGKGTQSWSSYGETSVEKNETYSCFVLRKGHFYQDVELPKGSYGQYLVFVGRGAGKRINTPAGPITTRAPYLYGYMMQPPPPGGKEILAYLQGQNMLAQITATNEWVNMWGIFEVPEGTTKVRFFLMGSAMADDPHEGAPVRFASLGLYLFQKKVEAEAFAMNY